MSIAQESEHLPIEPLFMQGGQIWPLVWAVSLVMTVLGAFALSVQQAGSWGAFITAWQMPWLVGLSVALLTWSAAWLGQNSRLFRHPWRLVTFIMGCWVLFIALSVLHPNFTYLAFSLILQAFIFLPFRWSFVSVVLFIAVGFLNAGTSPKGVMSLLTGMLLVLGFAALLSTLLFYVGRANREAKLREALIQRLEAAQQTIAEREREAGVLAERARLSRDLHDTLAQGFASVIAQLSAAELALSPQERQAQAHLAVARDIARGNLQDIRQLVWALRPAELRGDHVDTALSRLTASWSRQVGLPATFEVVGPFKPLLPEVEVALLRVLQEALSNAGRHARARTVTVRLVFEGEFVMLDVADDGLGFDTEADENVGFGLTGMRERLEVFGGRLMLESALDEGTVVTAALPLTRASHSEVRA